MSDDEFRDLIASSLTCRVDQKEDCSGKMDYFLDRCFYQPGQYGSEEDFHKLSERMTEHEQVLCWAPSSCWQSSLYVDLSPF